MTGLPFYAQHKECADAGGNADGNPGKVVASRCVKDEACQRRADNPAQRGGARDEADEAAEGPPAEVFTQDSSPERDHPPKTEGK